MHKQQILNHQVEVCFTDAAFVKIEVMGEQTAGLRAVGGTLGKGVCYSYFLSWELQRGKRKAPAEAFYPEVCRLLFITPIVVLLAFLIVALPALVAG